jgi:hypothetical protein
MTKNLSQKFLGSDTVDSFSSDKYRLLESVFSWEDDLEFLASQPGYSREIGHLHRKTKRALACNWIAELQREFNELHEAGLALVVNSPVERGDLNDALRRLKFTFTVRTAILRLRLRWGLAVPQDIQELTIIFERLIGYSCIIRQDLPSTN